MYTQRLMKGSIFLMANRIPPVNKDSSKPSNDAEARSTVLHKSVKLDNQTLTRSQSSRNLHAHLNFCVSFIDFSGRPHFTLTPRLPPSRSTKSMREQTKYTSEAAMHGRKPSFYWLLSEKRAVCQLLDHLIGRLRCLLQIQKKATGQQWDHGVTATRVSCSPLLGMRGMEKAKKKPVELKDCHASCLH